jgi:hypothetical protein
MLRDLTIWIAESLFYLTNGVPLLATPWIFVWVLVWGSFALSPVFYGIHAIKYTAKRNVNLLFVLPLTVMTFFMGLHLAISPVMQVAMMQECETVEFETVEQIIDGELKDIGTIEIGRCRYKNNYYQDFGEWQFQGEIK